MAQRGVHPRERMAPNALATLPAFASRAVARLRRRTFSQGE